jgi:hypothetical protein
MGAGPDFLPVSTEQQEIHASKQHTVQRPFAQTLSA